ncbi:MAG: GDP-L-fucose synthase [Deltaproteobacteria bacterium]|nr:GDP-L-fucose synthase [Deltaproteobacteria bacterium]
MNQHDRIFVAGHKGMVGSAICRSLHRQGFKNLILAGRDELDLTQQSAVRSFMAEQKPDCVVVAAAHVGGILANDHYSADFISNNIMIGFNLIQEAFRSGVRRLVFLGSSCIYPKEAPNPIRETQLLTGALEITNRAYAIAKIASMELVYSLKKQYNASYYSLMPCNLYGPGDNFHPTHSHVIPGLIRRFVEAEKKQLPEVVIWGSGTVRREFLYVDDCADGIVHTLRHFSSEQLDKLCKDNHWSHLNLGYGSDLTIAELAEIIRSAVGYQGMIRYDSSKPDGTRQKLMDSSLLRSTGWKPLTDVESGIRRTLDWYHSSENLRL